MNTEHPEQRLAVHSGKEQMDEVPLLRTKCCVKEQTGPGEVRGLPARLPDAASLTEPAKARPGPTSVPEAPPTGRPFPPTASSMAL